MADEEKRTIEGVVDEDDDDRIDDRRDKCKRTDDEHVDEDTEVDACCICQDLINALEQGHLSSCDHRFHFNCIVAWARVTNLCPLCKTKFNAVTQQDAQGVQVHREVINDTRQVYRPDPSDHDIAAQLRLINQARCEHCGSGEDEHVLLLCEALGCGIASHTYCIGLRTVPNTSWYCPRHATTQQRASDAIERPAMTVTTRRRTRRLASLMSNVLRGRDNLTATRARRQGTRGFVAVEEVENRRPMRGIAAAYALRMSRELMQVQQRADAMFARGDLTQSSLYGQRESSGLSAGRPITRSIVAASGPTTIDQTFGDQSRTRQELAAAVITAHDHGFLGDSSGCTRPSQRINRRVSSTFAPEYCALAKLMQDAAASDNYASSVTLLIPKTAKLRLVSRVKTFFGRLNRKEKAAAVELGCLSVLHQWIYVPQSGIGTASSPNPQVFDAVLAILETLPVRNEDLVEEEGLQGTLDKLSELLELSIETRQRIIELSAKWCKLKPPVSCALPRPQVRQPLSSPVHAAQDLPVITAFTSIKRPARSNGKRKRDVSSWSDIVVKYVKAKLYPLYSVGKLTRERFKSIVKEVASLFSQEASSMQSAVLLPSGELSNLAKSRVKKLIDRVYKDSIGRTSASRSAGPTPLLMHAALQDAQYSAVPSIKHQ